MVVLNLEWQMLDVGGPGNTVDELLEIGVILGQSIMKDVFMS